MKKDKSRPKSKIKTKKRKKDKRGSALVSKSKNGRKSGLKGSTSKKTKKTKSKGPELLTREKMLEELERLSGLSEISKNSEGPDEESSIMVINQEARLILGEFVGTDKLWEKETPQNQEIEIENTESVEMVDEWKNNSAINFSSFTESKIKRMEEEEGKQQSEERKLERIVERGRQLEGFFVEGNEADQKSGELGEKKEKEQNGRSEELTRFTFTNGVDPKNFNKKELEMKDLPASENSERESLNLKLSFKNKRKINSIISEDKFEKLRDSASLENNDDKEEGKESEEKEIPDKVTGGGAWEDTDMGSFETERLRERERRESKALISNFMMTGNSGTLQRANQKLLDLFDKMLDDKWSLQNKLQFQALKARTYKTKFMVRFKDFIILLKSISAGIVKVNLIVLFSDQRALSRTK